MSNKKKIDMEFTFIYDGNHIKEKEAFAYASSLGQHKINEWNLDKKSITNRQLADIASKLDVTVKELVDKQSDVYKDELEGKDLDDQDLLTLLTEKISLIKTPILLTNKGGKFINSPFDLNNVDMAFGSFTDDMSNKDEK